MTLPHLSPKTAVVTEPIGRWLDEGDAPGGEALELGGDVIHGERGVRDAVRHERPLVENWLRRS